MRISDWSSDVCSSDLRGQLSKPQDRLGRRCRTHHYRGVSRSAALMSRTAGIDLGDFMETAARGGLRSEEERRVGKECVSTCRCRWSADPEKKQHVKKQ